MKYYFCFLLLISLLSGFAQDQLFKKDNSKLDVKILEINQTEIKYKMFNYLDGPTIIISKSDVALIIYQNGSHEAIITKPEPTVIYENSNSTQIQLNKDKLKLEKFLNLISTKNLVSVNVMDPLNGTFSLSYLREFAHNNANLYIPVSVGFTEPYMNQSSVNTFYSPNRYNVSDYKFSRKTFEIGLGIHLQTTGKRAVTHYIGPYIAIAQYSGTFSENKFTTDSLGYNVLVEKIDHSFILNRTFFMLNNGFLFRVTQNFNIIVNAAFGVKKDIYVSNNPEKYYNSTNNYIYPSTFPISAFKLGLGFGYRF